MKNLRETRRKNLFRLLCGYPTQKAFAEDAGLAPSYLNQLLQGTRGIGEQTARKIEAKLKLQDYDLDSVEKADSVSEEESASYVLTSHKRTPEDAAPEQSQDIHVDYIRTLLGEEHVLILAPATDPRSRLALAILKARLTPSQIASIQAILSVITE